jgi:hypothetical protein
MGVFDIPTPVFEWLDAHMGLIMPAGMRLALWGVAGALVSMLLYRAISAQERVARGKVELAEARRTLDAYEGEFAGALPLMRRLLRVAVAQVGRVGWPALLASLPLLSLLLWMGTAYGYRYPGHGEQPDIQTVPSRLQASWLDPVGPAAAPHVVIVDDSDRILTDIPLVEPVPMVHKRQWWNALFGNPAGYLPPQSPVDRVDIELPRKHYLLVGPGWMRGWETVFLVPLLATSVALKVLVRIE